MLYIFSCDCLEKKVKLLNLFNLLAVVCGKI